MQEKHNLIVLLADSAVIFLKKVQFNCTIGRLNDDISAKGTIDYTMMFCEKGEVWLAEMGG